MRRNESAVRHENFDEEDLLLYGRLMSGFVHWQIIYISGGRASFEARQFRGLAKIIEGLFTFVIFPRKGVRACGGSAMKRSLARWKCFGSSSSTIESWKRVNKLAFLESCENNRRFSDVPLQMKSQKSATYPPERDEQPTVYKRSSWLNLGWEIILDVGLE